MSDQGLSIFDDEPGKEPGDDEKTQPAEIDEKTKNEA